MEGIRDVGFTLVNDLDVDLGIEVYSEEAIAPALMELKKGQSVSLLKFGSKSVIRLLEIKGELAAGDAGTGQGQA